MIREYPRPVGNEVILREGHVRITAYDHLGKIAMHNAEATWKMRYLRGEEGVGCGLPDQLVDSGAGSGPRSYFIDRIR